VTTELTSMLDAARDGDERAWDELFRRSYPRLLTYAGRRLPTDELAKDAVAETMIRAVAGLDRFRHEGAGFDAWMYGILRHVVIDIQRTLFREGPGLVPEAVEAGPGPGDRAVAEEDADEVRAAFMQLSAADQELLELRVISELSVDEVAAIVGRRAGAVRMAQGRALSRLRAILAGGERSASAHGRAKGRAHG
jgi:RNA polymerase sigma-70 factor (ECF subfamily)